MLFWLLHQSWLVCNTCTNTCWYMGQYTRNQFWASCIYNLAENNKNRRNWKSIRKNEKNGKKDEWLYLRCSLINYSCIINFTNIYFSDYCVTHAWTGKNIFLVVWTSWCIFKWTPLVLSSTISPPILLFFSLSLLSRLDWKEEFES